MRDGKAITKPKDLLNLEVFWNLKMAEYAKFISGLLDPSEETLIETARMFGREFDTLTAEDGTGYEAEDGYSRCYRRQPPGNCKASGL